MDLASEVITELKAKDLNGANITKIKYLPNETQIAFVIQGIEVFLKVRNAVEYAITSIVYQGQVFDDPNVLSQYDAWVKYVLAEVYPIVESKRFEAAELAYKANVETLCPEEDAVVGTGENVSKERLEEAEARGRKEGFKAARKTNEKDIRALKNKYNIIITMTVVILIAAFAALWILMGSKTGENALWPITEEGEVVAYQNITYVHPIDGESPDAQPEQDDEEAIEQLVATLAKLGETFEFDNFEITFGTNISWDVIENEFSELNDKVVFRLPISIINLSDKARKFDMFSCTQYNPSGKRLDSISSFFVGDAIDWSDDISPNETREAYVYVLFDGDGEYVIEFNNSLDRIKVIFNIQQ